MKRDHRLLALIVFAATLSAFTATASEPATLGVVVPPPVCVPFGGTIYGWHSDAWYGVGDFTVGKQVLHATIVDPNTGFSDLGKVWLGTETASFDFGHGDRIDLMTEFICELDPEAMATSTGVAHVNETGYFANGTGRFRRAYGRFNLQGPFGPGVTLPPSITPGENDGWFWIGQYVGSICGVN